MTSEPDQDEQGRSEPSEDEPVEHDSVELRLKGLHLIVVTGMSGAGRSSALRVLEDLGYFCVDNLPPALAPALIRLLDVGEIVKVGLGMDVRTGAFLEGAGPLLDQLEAAGGEVQVVFLDCADGTLIRRFSETRRPHPLAGEGGDVPSAIRHERERLSPLRQRADHVIDTSRLSVHELRSALIDYTLKGGEHPRTTVRVLSFGYKYGLPVNADLVFDLRYLPNPHFVPELRPLTGLDPSVAGYVLSARETKELLEEIKSFLTHTLPRYEREGKAYLTIALGCTGGRHRSVALAVELGRWLAEQREEVRVSHRDAGR